MTLTELEAMGVQCVGGTLFYKRAQIGSLEPDGPSITAEGYRLLPQPELPVVDAAPARRGRPPKAVADE